MFARLLVLAGAPVELAETKVAVGNEGAHNSPVPGLVDLTSIPAGTARKIALTHMTVTLIVIGLFGVSLWLRTSDSLGGWPAAVSGIGLLLLGFGGWLGGELVFVHGMGRGGGRGKG